MLVEPHRRWWPQRKESHRFIYSSALQAYATFEAQTQNITISGSAHILRIRRSGD
jgi:hypothetical protein